MKSASQKLAIRPGQKVAFVNAPPGYRETIGGLPEDAEVVTGAHEQVALVFVTDMRQHQDIPSEIFHSHCQVRCADALAEKERTIDVPR